MALGASRSDMVRWIVRQGFIMSVAGVAVGLAAAMAMSRVLEKLLFGVKPLDPLTMASAPVLLLAIAMLASVIPSWRASKADPASSLRYE